MFCANCGAWITEDQNYCSVCGRRAARGGAAPASSQASGAQAAATRGRVERHIQILAVLWIVWAVIRLLPGFGLLFFGRFILPAFPFNLRSFFMPFAAFTGAYFLAFAAFCFVTGWGLMERKSWARVVAIIAAILSLIHPVLGTALGIYTLWVIAPRESEEEYRRLSQS